MSNRATRVRMRTRVARRPIKQIRAEIEDARVWVGFHYRSSVPAGLKLGEKVAHWDLQHAFRPTHDGD